MRIARRLWPRRNLALVLGLASILATGCVAVHHSKIDALARTRPEPRIVLMPVDVELAELTAGGLPEVNAAWSRAASQHIAVALRDETRARQTHLVEYVAEADTATLHHDRQLVEMHRAVGLTILRHHYVPAAALPSKGGKFDWSLGPAVRSLRQRHDADYALFLFVRDSYTSTGRAALIVAAAMLGVAVQGGTQVGFAALVDLETGDIVWFNRLLRGEGDLRTQEPARETVKVLLTGLPK